MGADIAAALAACILLCIVRYGHYDHYGKAGLAALRCNAFIDSFHELPGMLCEPGHKTGQRQVYAPHTC